MVLGFGNCSVLSPLEAQYEDTLYCRHTRAHIHLLCLTIDGKFKYFVCSRVDNVLMPSRVLCCNEAGFTFCQHAFNTQFSWDLFFNKDTHSLTFCLHTASSVSHVWLNSPPLCLHASRWHCLLLLSCSASDSHPPSIFFFWPICRYTLFSFPKPLPFVNPIALTDAEHRSACANTFFPSLGRFVEQNNQAGLESHRVHYSDGFLKAQ